MISCRVTSRPEEIQIAKRSISRHMRGRMELAMIEYFQLGVESIQEKINLTRPNFSLPDLANLRSYNVLRQPELGVVYRNSKGDKCFFRLREIC